MYKGKRDPYLIFSEILDSIERIEKYTKNMDYDSYLFDQKTQDASIRCFEIIGEAIKNLSSDFELKYPEINFKGFAKFRDILMHKYFGVDLLIVWEAITEDVPELKKGVLTLLEVFKLPD